MARKKEDYFISPTKGIMSFSRVMEDIEEYIAGLPTSSYKIIIGSDSQAKNNETVFVTAIVVHRIGKGARYYYKKKSERHVVSLRQKIFFETALSLEVGSQVAHYFSEHGRAELPVEIHIDVGNSGETRELIKEVVGMVLGSGFTPKIKPEAYGATSVADKYTK
ncbi:MULTISPECIES: ribonuclease H-like YkuK family protein [Carboxydothermus]|uniref:DUF458 domain-containing protein n=2 Tax=Carboxydothermus TaxID=129957 RepID=Q3A8X6_CARHZ|nr:MULTISPECIES: ribonuclease H-like YkuK family protein [Carboxydothermus]ABB14506.1 conserved hypothetical protein [Carboxydothermus hydrogenoformans Z-2901]NYE57649.1 hypothetical protein [Carboxydothermus ferrireducens DSM 11255]